MRYNVRSNLDCRSLGSRLCRSEIDVGWPLWRKPQPTSVRDKSGRGSQHGPVDLAQYQPKLVLVTSPQ